MAKNKKNDDKDLDTGFDKKHRKHLPTGFEDSAETMSEDDLRKLIVDSEKTIGEVEQDLDADERLKNLKMEVKDISDSFKDLIKTHRAKIAYSVFLLKSRGNL